MNAIQEKCVTAIDSLVEDIKGRKTGGPEKWDMLIDIVSASLQLAASTIQEMDVSDGNEKPVYVETKRDGSEVWTYKGNEYSRWSGREPLMNERVTPGVVCTCGSTAFQLDYGNYQLEATCPNCGNNVVVYDG